MVGATSAGECDDRVVVGAGRATAREVECSAGVSLELATLWPPNGKMRAITPTFTVADNCDPAISTRCRCALTSLAGEGELVVVAQLGFSFAFSRR